jgi:hypothetical protein
MPHDVHESHFLRYQAPPNDPQHTHQVKGWVFRFSLLYSFFQNLSWVRQEFIVTLLDFLFFVILVVVFASMRVWVLRWYQA